MDKRAVIGATKAEWARLTSILTADERRRWVPIVSHDEGLAGRCRFALGKVPSEIGADGRPVAIKGWQEGRTAAQVPAEPSPAQGFGLCLGYGELYAIDCDCDDEVASGEVMAAMSAIIRGETSEVSGLPVRRRATAPGRFAVIVRVDGWGEERSKSGLPQFPLACGGKVEVLGRGNQLVCCGTHPSGARYDWGTKGMTIQRATPTQMERLFGYLRGMAPAEAQQAEMEAIWMPKATAETLPLTAPAPSSGCRACIAAKVERFAATPQGQRHEALVSCLSSVMIDVATEGADVTEEEAKAMIRDAAVRNGLAQDAGGGLEQALRDFSAAKAKPRPVPWGDKIKTTKPAPQVLAPAVMMDDIPLPLEEYSPSVAIDAVERAERASLPATWQSERARLWAAHSEHKVRGKTEWDELKEDLACLVDFLGAPLLCGYEIAFDTFRSELVCRRYCEPGAKWATPDEGVVTDILLALERAGWKNAVGKRAMVSREMMGFGQKHSIDTMRQWLAESDHIPAWDGVNRVSGFFADYCGAERSEYTETLGRYLFAAMWGRANSVQPLKADIAIVLQGKQGCRKSSLVKALAFGRQEWSTDSVDLADDDKDNARKTLGRITAEIPEMVGSGRKSVAELKNFLSKESDSWTEKYESFAKTCARRCVYFLTTNESKFLQDSTGNRRLGVVKVGQIDIDAVRRDLPQLWAQGRKLFMDANGGKDSMEDGGEGVGIYQMAVERPLAEVSEDVYDADPWEERIADWLAEQEEKDALQGECRVRPSTILSDVVCVPIDRQQRGEKRRVRAILERLGWSEVFRRLDGRMQRVWVHDA